MGQTSVLTLLGVSLEETSDWAEDAACRADDVKLSWWAHDAGKRGRRVAARLCQSCPVLDRCDQLRRALGPAAEGTYAGVFLPYTGAAPGLDDIDEELVGKALDWEGRYGWVLRSSTG